MVNCYFSGRHMSKNRTADALFRVVYNITEEFNGDTCIIQSYDEAAVMGE